MDANKNSAVGGPGGDVTVVEIERGWGGAVIAVWLEAPDGARYCLADRGLVRDWRGAVIADPDIEIGAATVRGMRACAALIGLT